MSYKVLYSEEKEPVAISNIKFGWENLADAKESDGYFICKLHNAVTAEFLLRKGRRIPVCWRCITTSPLQLTGTTYVGPTRESSVPKTLDSEGTGSS
jgi:hypothetical protein